MKALLAGEATVLEETQLTGLFLAITPGRQGAKATLTQCPGPFEEIRLLTGDLLINQGIRQTFLAHVLANAQRAVTPLHPGAIEHLGKTGVIKKTLLLEPVEHLIGAMIREFAGQSLTQLMAGEVAPCQPVDGGTAHLLLGI